MTEGHLRACLAVAVRLVCMTASQRMCVSSAYFCWSKLPFCFIARRPGWGPSTDPQGLD